MKDRVGFTLAEVLITLGIIGVVAAMTIPTLMTKLNNIKLKSQFKEAYSLLSQAVKMYNHDENRVLRSSGKIYYKDLMPYFNGVTDCGGTSEVADDSEYCIVRQSNVNDKPNQVTNKDNSYKNYSKKTNYINTVPLDDGQFYTNNGMLFAFDANLKNVLVSVDINGKLSKPNAWGHDLFTFELVDSEFEGGLKLVPMGAPESIYNDTASLCSRTSTNTRNGIACTTFAISNQDYFKDLP